MKKIFIATLTILLMQVAASGQVTIQPGIPAVGLIQKNQLWNVLLVNSTSTNYKCVLQLVLRDRTTGMEIITASTRQFDVAAGARQLNANLVGPVQYNYLLPGTDNRLQGLLPAGNYTACYELTTVYPKIEKLAEECVQFDAEPLSPPILIFPADSALLENLPNQFSWIPPTPEGMFDRLRYELLITEVKDGQKAEEALQDNIPFYNDGALFSNRMSYPASAAAFEKDKWYAWQVTARDDKAYAGKSEVWVFKVVKEKPVKSPYNDSYIFVNGNASENNIFYITKKELLIKYYSFEKAANTSIIIKTTAGNIVQQGNQDVKYGDNFFTLPLSAAVAKGQLYRVEIKDSNNKVHTILFSITD